MSNSLTRFTPFNDLVRFDPFRAAESMLGDMRLSSPWRALEAEPRMRMDVEETEQAYLVRAELPGVQKEDIKITVDGDDVSITADCRREQDQQRGTSMCSERFVGQYYRRFTLPQEVDDSKAEAKCHDGILELTLPKRPGSTSRQISIQ